MPRLRNRFIGSRTLLALGLVGLTLAASDCGAAESSGGDADAITVVMGGGHPNLGFSQAYFAQQQGLFDKHSVDVRIEVVAGSVAPNLIASGRADLAVGGPPSALGLAKNGKDTAMIYGTTGKGSAGYLVGAPRVKSVKDCHRIGTPGPATSADNWAKVYNKMYGLGADIVGLASLDALVASVSTGAIDCAVTGKDTFATALDQRKVVTVIDPAQAKDLPADLEKNVVEAAFYGLPDQLEGKKAAVQRFVDALDESVPNIRKGSTDELAGQLRASPDWSFYAEDKLRTDLDYYRKFLAPNNGRISPEAWATELTWLGPDAADPERASFDRVIDMSYLDVATKER